MESLVSRMKGLIEASRSQTTAQRTETSKQLTELHNQVAHLVEDATYKGLNLLNNASAKLTVRFSDKADSKIEVDGVDFTAEEYLLTDDGAGGWEAAAVAVDGVVETSIGFSAALDTFDFTDATDVASYNDEANNAILALEATIENIRAKSSVIATNADILKVRLDFTEDYVSVLSAGADKLTLADLNEEGANLLALQTRQQIGIQALSFAGQSEQSVLSLFR
jgi:flagellin-like hook-associated protein FlgL